MRRGHGFTLVEMLVVLSIVALLVTMALPRYFGALAKARETTLRETLKTLRASIDGFRADRGRLPQSLSDLVEARYIREVPLDPITESHTSWVLVPSLEPDLLGVSDVRSGAPGESQDGSPYAAF